MYWRHDLFQIQLLVVVVVVVFCFWNNIQTQAYGGQKKKLGDHKHTSRSPYLFGTKKMVLHRHIDTCCCCWIVELEEKKIGKTPLVKIVRHRMSTFTTTTMMMMTFHPFLLSCSGYTQNLCVFFNLCRRCRCFFLWPVYTHTDNTKTDEQLVVFFKWFVFFFSLIRSTKMSMNRLCVCVMTIHGHGALGMKIGRKDFLLRLKE